MIITFNTNNMKGEIALGEDANVEECVDAFVAAMIAQGYSSYGIKESLRLKADSMDASEDKYC